MCVVAPSWSSSLARPEHSWLWVPAQGRDDGKLRLHRRPLSDAREPGGDVAVGGIERLADLVAEIDPAIEQDVGEREAVAAQILLARDLAVEPLQPIRSNHLEAGRRLRRARDPLFEKSQRLAKTVAVGERLGDVEIDPPGPHPAFGALLQRRADHRGG